MKKEKSLVDKTAEKIVTYIENAKLEIGDKLPNEYTLAKELEIGRSTLREAIKILVSQNIVEVRHGSGTYVISLRKISDNLLGFIDVKDSLKLTKDLFTVRFLIEPRMAALAAQNIRPDEKVVLKQLARAIEEDMAAGDDFHKNLDVQFHSAIAEASRNLAMQNLIPVIIESISLYNDFFTSKESQIETVEAHREIVLAINAENPSRAHDAMLIHIAQNQRKIEQFEKSTFENI